MFFWQARIPHRASPGRERRQPYRHLFPLRPVRAITFLVAAFFGVSGAITAGESNPAHDAWSVGSVWQPNAVVAVVQSGDGYLWLGTYNGLVRYDGVRFTVFNNANAPGLHNNRVTSLFADARGALWIGHETGHLTRLFQGRFEPVELPSSWPGGAIEGIAEDSEGDLWLANDAAALFRVRDGLVLSVPGEASLASKVSIYHSGEGHLWVTSNGKVASIEKGKLIPQRFDDPEGRTYYDRAMPAADGGVWVCAAGQARKWLGNGWVETRGGFASVPGTVNVLRETSSGHLLVGTIDGGAFLLGAEGTAAVQLDRGNGLSHDWVRAVWEDHEKNLWIGTGAGLDIVRRRKVNVMQAPDGWRGCGVLSFAAAADGATWFGTEGAGVYRFRDEEWTRFSEADGLSNLFIWSVLETRVSEPRALYIGTWGRGLQRLAGERFETPPEFSRITAPVVSLFESGNGDLWIGTTVGLYRHRAGTVEFVAGKEKLVLPDIRAIAEASDGSLWLGMFGGGLGRMRDGRIQQFRKQDGLGGEFIQCLHTAGNDTLWIGTADKGLVRFRDGKFVTISTAQGLPDTFISHLVDDGVGNFWMGSSRGIIRASMAQLNSLADGTASRARFLVYGQAEGMASLYCPGGFQPGATRMADGSLWFPTANGVATIHSSRARPNLIPPPVVIEELIFPSRRVNVPEAVARKASEGGGASVIIPAGEKRFEIRYTALSFISPDKVRFKHRLDPLEEDWVEAGPERLAAYSYLPPGRYEFQVMASNNDDVWNSLGATLTLTVLPRFYQTWWFQLLSVGSGAGVVAGAVWLASRRRIRRKLEQLERQRALERERARIARDIHDDLGASLTRITLHSQSARSELADSHQAARDVDEIYRTARELTRAMDEIVWAVNPKHDTLDSLVTYLGRFAQAFLSTAGLRCRLDLPVDLPSVNLTSEVRHNLFLAFKESLNNVVKHARATEVRIALELGPDEFVLVVADNGRGFQWSDRDGGAEPGNSERVAAGNGISNMRKRIEEIGGRCEWKTAPAEGTRVLITISARQGRGGG